MTRSQLHNQIGKPNNTEITEATSTAMNAAITVTALANRLRNCSRGLVVTSTEGNRAASSAREFAGMPHSCAMLGVIRLTPTPRITATLYCCGRTQWETLHGWRARFSRGVAAIPHCAILLASRRNPKPSTRRKPGEK